MLRDSTRADSGVSAPNTSVRLRVREYSRPEIHLTVSYLGVDDRHCSSIDSSNVTDTFLAIVATNSI